jgi:uncharacterized protein with PIN domain
MQAKGAVGLAAPFLDLAAQALRGLGVDVVGAERHVRSTMTGPGNQQEEDAPRFVCDAMLGGLARWLRAAGYSAEFSVRFADGEIVRKSVNEDKILVTSDSGIMERYAVEKGLARTVFIPPGLPVVAQLARVLGELGLALQPSRCMDCNGTLMPATLEEVAEDVPEKVRQWCDRFFVCEGCGKVLWHGTHWLSISSRLRQAQGQAESLRKGE